MGEEKPLTPVRELCSICQFPVEGDEVRTWCPHCGLPFHAECWEENYGCSAYGCPQVNALKPARAAAPRPAAPAALGPDPFPWDFLFVGAGAVSALVGLVTYGVPSVLVLLVALTARVLRKRKGPVWVLLLCVLVCLAGAVGGFLASRYLWAALANK
jgi:hypothetical protein